MKTNKAIVDRYGGEFGTDRFIPLPKILMPVLKKLKLTRHEAWLLIILLEYASIDPTRHTCYPSYDTIVKDDPWMDRRNVSRALKALVAKVGLVITPGRKGAGEPNTYDLTEPLARINKVRSELSGLIRMHELLEGLEQHQKVPL